MGGDDYQVIRGGRVLDVASGAAPARDVLVRGRRIAAVGEPGLAAPESAAVRDAADRLLMPGMVNAHTHGHGSLSKGMGDLWSVELLLNAGPWISARRTLEDKYLSARLNGVEMLMKGCTTAYDMYFEFPVPTPEGLDAVAGGYADAGVRAVIAPMMADRSLYEALPGLLDHFPPPLRRRAEAIRMAPFEQSVAAAAEVLCGWRHDRERIRPALGPTIPLHCSDAFLVACRDLAEEHDVAVHMHLAESRGQAVSGLRRYGRTLTAHLDRLGLLSPRFTGAHGVWLDGDDIARLADHGCSIAHNPGSNLRLGSGIAPVRELLERGVNVGIGTDGSNSSDHQNMFDAVRLAANLSRITTPEYERWVSAGEALAMGTAGGARAAGLAERVGRIAPGHDADIVFLDLGAISFTPLNDPLRQVVSCEDGSAVDTVMVAGEVVLEDRRPARVRLDTLRADAARAVERLRAATEADRRLALELERHVATFCIGLARCDYHVHRTLPSARRGDQSPPASPDPA